MKELSTSATSSFNKSIDYARRITDKKVRSEYLLYGISSNVVVRRSLNRFNISVYLLREKLDEYANKTHCYGATNVVFDKTTHTPNLIDLLDNAALLTFDFNLDTISCEMIYLAILSTPNCTAYKLLSLILKSVLPTYSMDRVCKETKDIFLNHLAIINNVGKQKSGVSSVNSNKSNFNNTGNSKKIDDNVSNHKVSKKETSFGLDLVELARNGKINSVIGRKAQIDRTINILSRKTKNNPVLIGEPGVGKTAIIEGIAYAIAKNEIPRLKDCRIVSLNMADLVSGSKYRGDFEEKLKTVIEEGLSDPNLILFIDEIHTVCGAGGSEGSVDASNILKPYLARGELSIIGATTISEYKLIEKDPALERRFQPVVVPEPTVEECSEILSGVVDKYEDFHNVIISDDVIPYCVSLANRYIQDRFLPDKAFDLLDETCSKLSRNNKSDNDYAVIFKNHIRETLIELTGISIPSEQNESLEYLNVMEQNLKNNLIGQNHAVEKVCKVIKRNKVGINDPKKPIGSFIFAGTTGVGKTELAKRLSFELFGTESDMIRIDMTEYMTKENISKLIGAAPGYVGYDEEGILTRNVRRKPYSIVLFDEIEKAHVDIFNILLQILDDGVLTDSHGRKINFKNTIIIMTTNLGYEAFNKKASNPLGFNAIESNDISQSKDEIDNIVRESLKNHFRPEFLNRVDDIIVFNQLNKLDSQRITALLLSNLKTRLESQEIIVNFNSDVIEYINDIGFDIDNGARPLKRAIQTNIEDLLADSVISGEVIKRLPIYCSVENNQVVFHNIQ